MKYCPNCGNEVGGAFCTKCGTKIEESVEPTTPPLMNNQTPKQDTWLSMFKSHQIKTPDFFLDKKVPESIADEYKPLSILGFFVLVLVLSICCVGQLVAIFFALEGIDNRNIVNYSRYYLLAFLAIFVLYIVFVVIFGGVLQTILYTIVYSLF